MPYAIIVTRITHSVFTYTQATGGVEKDIKNAETF